MEEEGTNIVIITARKRSLRRLCFYRCVSIHRGGVCVWLGGVHGCWGVCVVAGGGACMVAGGHAWLLARGGMYG